MHAQFKPFLTSLALQSLNGEPNSVNVKQLLNIVVCIVFEEYAHTPEVLPVVARTVLEKIGLFSWPEDVTCAGLDALARLILLIKGSPEMHSILGREIVATLCHFVDRLLENENLVVSLL